MKIRDNLTIVNSKVLNIGESLEVYRKRIKEESPWFDEWGIHVMASTNESNEIIIGDSHEYGFSFDPFNKQRINDYILDYLNKFLLLPNLEMSETWYGVYAKNPEGTEFVHEVDDSVTIITGFGGAGMTFSFGFAQDIFSPKKETAARKVIILSIDSDLIFLLIGFTITIGSV
jgi:hypothetical protein